MALRVRDRSRVDLLVLATLAHGSHDYAEVGRTLASGTGVEVPGTRIVPTLHRLARNRLITRERTGSRRYVLTEVGRRVLAARSAEALRFADAVRSLREE